MNSLWDFLLDYLQHDRRCPICDQKLWVGYFDGHVSDSCLDCEAKNPTPSWNLDMPGYITSYPVPDEPLPDCIETRWDGGRSIYLEEHERYYRLKMV